MARTIFVNILANATQFKRELTKAVAATNSANTSFKRFSRAAGVAGLALGTGLAIGLEKSAKAAMSFDEQMRQIQTQAGGTAKDVTVLGDAILKLAPSTTQGPEALAKAMYHLKSAGMDNVSAMSAVAAASKAATMGMADLEQVTNALVGVYKSGIRGAQDFDSMLGTLNATVGAGNMRFEDLVEALSSGIMPVAKGAGLSLRDVGAALATLTRQGVPAEQGATKLRTALMKLVNPSNQSAKAMDAVHLSGAKLGYVMRTEGLPAAMKLIHDRFANLPGVISLAKKAMGQHLSATEIAAAKNMDAVKSFQLMSEALGGARTAATVIVLANSYKDLGRIYDQIGRQAGNFNELAKKALDEPANRARLAKAAWETLQIQIGRMLLPAVSQLADIFGALGAALARHPAIARALTIGLVALAAALIATSIAGTIAANVMAFSIAGGLIAGAVAAYYLVANFDKVKAALDRFSGWLQGVFGPVWRAVGDAAVRATEAIVNALPGIARAAVSVGKAIVVGVFNAVIYLPRQILGVFTQLAQAIISAAQTAYNAAVYVGRTIVVGVLEGVARLGVDLGTFLAQTIANVFSSLNIPGASPVKSAAAKMVGDPMGRGVIEGYISGSRDLPYKVADSVQKALDAARSKIEANRSRLSAAWSQLSQDALSAFDAIQRGILTPAERALAEMDRQVKLEGLNQALQDGQKAVQDAVPGYEKAYADLQAAQAGGDPAAIADAQKAFDDARKTMESAQKQLYDAQRDIQRNALEEQAAEERKQLDARNALRRRHFEAELAQLEKALARKGATYGEAQRAITRLLKKYGVDYQSAGLASGIAFADGLVESEDAVSRAAAAIAASFRTEIVKASKLDTRAIADGTSKSMKDAADKMKVPKIPKFDTSELDKVKDDIKNKLKPTEEDKKTLRDNGKEIYDTYFGPVKWMEENTRGAIRTIGQHWGELPGTIWEFFQPAWQPVKGFLGESLDSIKTHASGVVGKTGQFFGDLPGKVWGFFQPAWAPVQTNIGSAFDSIRTHVSGVANKVVGFFTELPGRISNVFTSGWSTSSEAIRGTFHDVLTWAQGVAQDVIGVFRGLPTRIANAMKAGAIGTWELVKDALKTIFGGIYSWLAKVFDWHSPVGMTQDFGRDLVLGVVKGLKDNGPKLKDAFMKEFGHLFIPSLSAPSGTGGIAGTDGLVGTVLNALRWARTHGWRGDVTSGLRSYEWQKEHYDNAEKYGLIRGVTIAKPGTSEHEKGRAVDVSDWEGFRAAMASAPPGSRLIWRGPSDPVHFSVSGHAAGGLIQAPLHLFGEAGPEAVIPFSSWDEGWKKLRDDNDEGWTSVTKSVDTLTTATKDGWTQVKTSVDDGWSLVSATVGPTTMTSGESDMRGLSGTSAGNKLWKAAADGFGNKADLVTRMIAAKQGVDDWADTQGTTNMLGVGGKLGEAAATGLHGAKDKIASLTVDALDTARPAWQHLIDLARGWHGEVSAGVDQLGNIASGLSGIDGKSATITIHELVERRVKETIYSRTLPWDTMPADGAFAGGGYARAGRAYLVGERGPELFAPGRSGTVYPIGPGAGGVTVNLTVLGTVTSERDLVKTVRDGMLNEMRRLGYGNYFGGMG